MVWLADGENKFDYTFSCLDRIPVCDGQTDGQTSCHGIVHAAYASRGKNYFTRSEHG